MIAQTASVVPESLVRLIYELDRSMEGFPVLPDDKIEAALSWLRRVVLDFDALDAHIAILQELYGLPFRYPRMRRDQLPEQQLAAGSGESRFPYHDLLEEGRVFAILEGGPDAVRPNDKNRHELPRLLLNPMALHDLFDVINDVLPERWLSDMQEVGKEMLQREVATPAVAPQLRVVPVKEPSVANGNRKIGGRDARKAAMWLGIGALAASILLVGVWLLFGDFVRREAGRGGAGELQASVTPRYGEVKGTKNRLTGLQIKSEFKGHATVIALTPKKRQEVIPETDGDKEIRLVGDGSVETVQWPDDLEDASVALIILTETPADGTVRRLLDGKKFTANQADEVERLLREELQNQGYKRFAITRQVLAVPQQ